MNNNKQITFGNKIYNVFDSFERPTILKFNFEICNKKEVEDGFLYNLYDMYLCVNHPDNSIHYTYDEYLEKCRVEMHCYDFDDDNDNDYKMFTVHLDLDILNEYGERSSHLGFSFDSNLIFHELPVYYNIVEDFKSFVKEFEKLMNKFTTIFKENHPKRKSIVMYENIDNDKCMICLEEDKIINKRCCYKLCSDCISKVDKCLCKKDFRY